jgi:hypothetical protein
VNLLEILCLLERWGLEIAQSAAMLLSRLTDNDISSCTGSGTGMFGDDLEEKDSNFRKEF